jgi:hypothetical protein
MLCVKNTIRSHYWRAILPSCAALAVVLAMLVPLQTPEAHALPSGMPTHFAFGLGAGQGDTWMPSSGITWDYRMQYLVGGVNTGSGWETWNANGTFALNYAQESAQHGYIPMFPYYELLQSNGPCGNCGEGQKDLANLNTSSVMQAYYQNFTLLMKRLGPSTYDGIQGFGKAAVIDIEPDFSGGYAVQAANTSSACYGYCTGQGNDPSLVKAIVSSSGNPDVAAYPNTYAGFIQALAHLRDLYAPNVVLGLDVSPWATGDDIGMDTNPNTDMAALGQQVGVFLSKTGPHDILLNDPLDRDAAQYKVVYGQNRWWDRLNVTAPNFHRWEQYLQSARLADGSRSILLWQVPLGNQYFDTENNTTGHYQDNRPEYIFGHIPELIQSGIIGAIFMPGNAGNSTYNDQVNDGVTNPASFCATDGLSSGQICNNHVSTVSDDDGGFVRMSAQQYYTNPVPLSGGGGSSTSTPVPTAGTATSTPIPTPTAGAASYTTSANGSPNSIAAGGTVSITTSVTSSAASTALVDLEVYDPTGAKVFQQYWDNQSFGAGQTRTFSSSWQAPSTAALGTYNFAIGVFSPGWGTLYSWNGSAGSFAVGASAPATSTPTAVPSNTPTALPTNTPTALPTNTPTSAPVQPGFTTSETDFPSSVSRGATETITASVKSAASSTVLVDVEVYDSSGAKVFQQWWDNQAFGAGQTRTFTARWAVPSTARTGMDTVKIGIFAPGWSALYAWNDQAGTFKVR